MCKFYWRSGNGMNEARYNLFCTKALNEVSLPFCRNAVVHHIVRANYQAATWRKAFQTNINVPSPNGSSWIIAANNEVLVRWMTHEQAPSEELLQNHSCDCKKSIQIKVLTISVLALDAVYPAPNSALALFVKMIVRPYLK